VSFVSVLKAGMSLNDEERKMCARFEDYTKKIRSKELRFTKEADKVIIEDPIAKDRVSLPAYFGRSMGKYDRQKVNEAENRTMVEAEFSQTTGQGESTPLTREAFFALLDQSEKWRFLIARNALAVIDEALASPTPLIVEGERYFVKLEESEKERKSLTAERDKANAELEELGAAHIALKARYEDCQRKLHIQSLGDKRTRGEGGF